MAINRPRSEREASASASGDHLSEETAQARGRAPDAVERLYAYWIVSVALLLFVVIIVTVYVCGALSSQARDYNRLLTELGNRVAALEIALARPPGPAVPGERVPAHPPAPGPSNPPAQPTSAPAKPERPSTAVEADRSRPPAEVAPAEADIVAQLGKVLVKGAAVPFVIADQAAAETLLTTALKYVQLADWSAPTWARLAVLARLLNRDQGADAFARRAYAAGDPLTDFAEVTARVLLAHGRAPDAMMHAQHFADQSDNSPTSRLLLARVYLATKNLAAADELVASIEDPAALTDVDKLTYARLCLDLQLWDRLAAVMNPLPRVPPELEDERMFLQAVALIQQNQKLVEALSLLDFLADKGGDESPAAAVAGKADREAPGSPQSRPAANARHPADPPPEPDGYDIATWRGVALMRGRQTETARQVLDAAAAMRADRPEAYYWRAMLEIREDQPETARNYLQNALATDARYAPAWEALGSLALNAGNLDAAVENLQKAVTANDRLASAHFLLAVAHAKASRREPAAAELQTTFQIDPAYLERAQQTEVLTRLFTADELKAMATPQPESAPAEPAGTPK